MRKILALLVISLLSVSCGLKASPPRPFVAEEVFAEANREIEKRKNYEEARRIFEEIKLKEAGGRYASLAQLRIADSYLAEDKTELAIEEYREFLRNYPRHKYASYAQYRIGMAYFGLIKGPERGYGPAIMALEAFKTLNKRYPRNPYREDIRYRVETARDVIQGHEFMVGDFYFRKGAYHGAIERLTGLLKDFPDYDNEAEALYRIAVSYKGIGEHAKAEKYLKTLGRKYPGSRLIKKAKEDFRRLPKDG